MSRLKGSPPRNPASPVDIGTPLKKVLFVCIGNACRSQMAEGFARKYGADVMVARSAGLAPAMSIPPLTHSVMREKNVAMTDHFPKPIDLLTNERFDVVVNMSGAPLGRNLTGVVEEWTVRDPVGESEDVFRAVRDEIEQRVMRMVLSFRSPARVPR